MVCLFPLECKEENRDLIWLAAIHLVLLMLGILEIKIKCTARLFCIRHIAKSFIRNILFLFTYRAHGSMAGAEGAGPARDSRAEHRQQLQCVHVALGFCPGCEAEPPPLGPAHSACSAGRGSAALPGGPRLRLAERTA